MQLVFILVEPKVPENVGAACRALRTQGFDCLRIVRSEAHHQPQARWVAHGADSVLDAIETFDTLHDALADIDLSLATSAKARHDKRRVLEPDDTLRLIRHHASDVPRVALVFGREDRGLSNDEVRLCDALTTLPLAQPYPSLNLGQAVMLYAYLLRQGLSDMRAAQAPTHSPQTDTGQKAALQARLRALFSRLDKVPGSALEHWAMEQLAWANAKDVHFLHTLCQSLERALDADRPSHPDT